MDASNPKAESDLHRKKDTFIVAFALNDDD